MIISKEKPTLQDFTGKAPEGKVETRSFAAPQAVAERYPDPAPPTRDEEMEGLKQRIAELERLQAQRPAEPQHDPVQQLPSRPGVMAFRIPH